MEMTKQRAAIAKAMAALFAIGLLKKRNYFTALYTSYTFA